jgi:Protein of unknown function (DUF3570)
MKRPTVPGRMRPAGRGIPPGRAVSLAVVLALVSPRPSARADDFLAYRYESYAEAGDRVSVRTQGFSVGEDVNPSLHLDVTLLNDAIAGASPTGIPAPAGSSSVPLAQLTDHRKAWEAGLSLQLGNVNVAVAASGSREHDYVSRGWSLNTATDLNAKNTTLLAGIAGHADDVETFFDPEHYYAGKQALSAIAGVRQILDPRTVVALNFTWGRETGYLADQYKLVQKTEELVPGSNFPLAFAENRPGERNMGILLASVNRAFPEARGALDLSYRYYADTFGVTANTVELSWIQKVGRTLTLTPDLRLHEQGAAKFYYYNLDGTPITPTVVPSPDGPAYSSDYRLSALGALTYGLKATWTLGDHLQLELGYDRYAMRGRDGVTPQSAYPVANIVSGGARLSW